MNEASVRRADLSIILCPNPMVDQVMMAHYWMPRIRRSRRLSYCVRYRHDDVAWIQCADPFGTKLAGPLNAVDIQDAVELCRGYFLDAAPKNVESCGIAMVLRRLPGDWYRSYGAIKKIAIVYQDIDAGQRGVVYKAVGFRPYAHCVRARHYLTRARSTNSAGRKIVWARPLRRVSGTHYDIALPVPIME